MSVEKVNTHVKNLFTTMDDEVEQMVNTTFSPEATATEIMEYVSKRLSSATNGYISTLYSSLSSETLQEAAFQSAKNANAFYDLELDEKMIECCKFDRKKSKKKKKGIEVHELNRVNTTVAAGVGTAAVGGALLAGLSCVVDIPVGGIISGAIAVGLAGSGITYCKIVPDINKQRLMDAVKSFMAELEDEMFKWVDEVVAYYNKQVEELKKTL